MEAAMELEGDESGDNEQEDDQFEDDEMLDNGKLQGLTQLIPSRSPSPVRISKSHLTKDGNQINFALEEDSADAQQIDDDINIDEMVQNMSEDKIKAETEKY